MAKLTKLDDFVCAQYLMALHRMENMFVFSFELILFLSGFEILPLLFVILMQEVLHVLATTYFFSGYI